MWRRRDVAAAVATLDSPSEEPPGPGPDLVCGRSRPGGKGRVRVSVELPFAWASECRGNMGPVAKVKEMGLMSRCIRPDTKSALSVFL